MTVEFIHYMVRIPPAAAEKRRHDLKLTAARKQKPVSPERLALLNWNVWLTNAPQSMLSDQEVEAVSRVRWQIELLFKLWKSVGMVDEWRSDKPWRVLCEVYAKLPGAVVRHWLCLTRAAGWVERSWVKTAAVVATHVVMLRVALHDLARLNTTLEQLSRVLAVACGLEKRRGTPSTLQRLQSLA